MGAFDRVNFAMSCPLCSKEVTGFQTKDRKDHRRRDYESYFDPASLKRFYTFCGHCGAWIEFCYVSPNWRLEVHRGGPRRKEPFCMQWFGARRLTTDERGGLPVLDIDKENEGTDHE